MTDPRYFPTSRQLTARPAVHRAYVFDRRTGSVAARCSHKHRNPGTALRCAARMLIRVEVEAERRGEDEQRVGIPPAVEVADRMPLTVPEAAAVIEADRVAVRRAAYVDAANAIVARAQMLTVARTPRRLTMFELVELCGALLHDDGVVAILPHVFQVQEADPDG